MLPRAYHFIMIADYAIGGFFAMIIFGLALFAFSLSGGLVKGYEMRAIGAAYTDLLAGLETEAHQLRANYCAQADVAALAQANCGVRAARASPGRVTPV